MFGGGGGGGDASGKHRLKKQNILDQKHTLRVILFLRESLLETPLIFRRDHEGMTPQRREQEEENWRRDF